MQATLGIEREQAGLAADVALSAAELTLEPSRAASPPIWLADPDQPNVQKRRLSFFESIEAVTCLRMGILPARFRS